MPLYLIDANVLISAHREYYPNHRVPEFWEWLAQMAQEGRVKIPIECYEEVVDGKDWLAEWLKKPHIKEVLLLQEEVDASVVANVVNLGYANDLTDDEVEEIGKDPFLVAYAEGDPDRIVVTTEVSRPGKKRANRKLPDVCDQFQVKRMHTYQMLDELKFTTGWKPPT